MRKYQNRRGPVLILIFILTALMSAIRLPVAVHCVAIGSAAWQLVQRLSPFGYGAAH